MRGGDAEPFADAAQKLAEEFGSVTATAVAAVCEPARRPRRAQAESHASLFQPGHMRRRLDQLIETNKRYGHPFGLVVFDVDGPGAREGEASESQETMLAVVGAALRESVRIVDETFRLEEDALCVLAPNQTTVEGVQMAERLLRLLDELEAAGGLRIAISAGVVACPEHGSDAEGLLQQGRRGDVASPCGGPAGGRRRLARSLTDSAKSVHNLRKPGFPLGRCRCPANTAGQPKGPPEMPGIRTNAAAEVLGVSPNTLRSWERRYGFPTPKRTVGNHRNYELVELQTLRDALAQTGNISSAIELARQRQSAPASGGNLLAALESFDEDAADRAVEESLALRPLERTVEELLLPAIDQLAADPDREAELEFASRWATGWLHGARRLASAASRPAGILLLDSSRGSDAEAVHAPGARPDPAPRRLPRADALQRARRRAARARPARPRPDRDRPLRPRRRHRQRGQAGPQDPRGRLRRARSSASAPAA